MNLTFEQLQSDYELLKAKYDWLFEKTKKTRLAQLDAYNNPGSEGMRNTAITHQRELDKFIRTEIKALERKPSAQNTLF